MPRSSGLLSAAIRRGGIRERSADCLAVPRLSRAVLPDPHFGKAAKCFRLIAEQSCHPVGKRFQVSNRFACHVVDGLEVAQLQPLVDVQVHGLVERQPPRGNERGGHGPHD